MVLYNAMLVPLFYRDNLQENSYAVLLRKENWLDATKT
jgi:hypothetical protein